MKLERLDQEIEELEKELLKRSQEFTEVAKKRARKKIKQQPSDESMEYIG
jgi:hypothetical protein